MGFRVAGVVLLTACYSPSYTESLPCSETGKCPPGQECDPIVQVCTPDVGDVPEYTAVAAGDTFTCAIRKDRSLWCWGDASQGQLGDNTFTARGTPGMVPGTADWYAIRAGYDTICGLRGEGELWCWGDRFDTSNSSDPQPRRIGTRKGWRAVDVSLDHACAIDEENMMWCWGWNVSGQLGVGDTELHTDPSLVSGGNTWLAVAAGEAHTCGIAMDRSLWCWGRDTEGQLGNGSPVIDSSIPQMSSPGPWEVIESYDSHSCALDAAGGLSCWGRVSGSLDLGPTITRIDGDYAAVSAGGGGVAMLRRDGTRAAFGDGSHYQRGDANRSTAMAPEGKDPRIWKAISEGARHGCAIRSDDSLWCWGSNEYGQLGDGTIGRKLEPVQIGTSSSWTTVSVAVDHGCGIEDGDMYCWGDNEYGQLGTGNKIPQRRMQRIGLDREWLAVSAGYNTTCAIDEQHGLWCWGNNEDSALGTGGTGGQQSVPVAIGAGRVWEHVAAGYHWGCAVAGSLWCWGRSRGTRPDEIDTRTGWLDIHLERDPLASEALGATAESGWSWFANTGDAPVAVPEQWLMLRSNYLHACGIRVPDTLWCEGVNSRGQVGDGTTTMVNSFVQIAATTPWLKVSAGFEHTCAIATDGGLWCWGANTDGELGINTDDDELTPTRLPAAGKWLEVSAGDAATCAIRDDHTLWCWGTNEHDELGDGTGSAPGPQVVR